MKKYVRPEFKTVNFINNSFLCLSGDSDNENICYTCPIKKDFICFDYNNNMHEWKHAIRYAVKHKQNRTFHFFDNEMSCPRKNCKIFIEWQKQQQKTK